MEKSAKRVCYIDCIRVFACFLVVAVHCNFAPSNPSDTIWTQILGVIGSPSSELFLAISGSLLIPVKVPLNIFLKKRFFKLLPPFLVWSLFGIWFVHFTGQTQSSAFVQLLSIPIKNTIIPVFWFMYTIMGMYLLAPVISPFLQMKGRSGGAYLLLLWGISLILPMTNIIQQDFYKESFDSSGILYQFSGYAGYMILGWYLRAYPLWFVEKKCGWLYPSIALAVIVAVIAMIGLFAPEYRCYVMDNLSFGNMLYVVALFTLIQSLFQAENIITKLAKKLTNYTFGIYLIHTFVIYAVYYVFPKGTYPAVFQLPATAISSFVLSLGIVWLLSSIKPLKWVVQGFSLNCK